jgi:hypothetical protein
MAVYLSVRQPARPPAPKEQLGFQQTHFREKLCEVKVMNITFAKVKNYIVWF